MIDFTTYFEYDPSSSTGIRRLTDTRKGRAGDEAGSLTHGHYFLRVMEDGVLHSVMSARFIWESTTGKEIGENEVMDHIDGDTKNNTLSNLRVISKADRKALDMYRKEKCYVMIKKGYALPFQTYSNYPSYEYIGGFATRTEAEEAYFSHLKSKLIERGLINA